MLQTMQQLAGALEAEQTTASALLERCLERAGSVLGSTVFIELLADRAREQARVADELRHAGRAPSRWSGIPISVKDLFDLEGQITRAGSTVLQDAAPAARTAPAIDRLERAGLVVVGRTNMTEFAYSGVGINPHYGTPSNPYDRAEPRIPGGSSSGAAISVTDGMAAAAIGTDTGGSCRIPAALTGIVGYKPTASRVPLDGVYPLSASLDSVGSLAPSAACCAVLDDLMAGGRGDPPAPAAPGDCRLGVLEHYVTDDLDQAVDNAYQRSLRALEGAGATLVGVRLPDIERLPELNARGGIAAAEAYAHHSALLAEREAGYDPRVAGRIRAGSGVSADELERIRQARAEMIGAFAERMAGLDGILAPTVPVVAPRIEEFAADTDYARLNLLLLRNPSLFNFLDGCAISLPSHQADEPPTGLMLAAPGGADRRLLAVAGALEGVLRPGGG